MASNKLDKLPEAVVINAINKARGILVKASETLEVERRCLIRYLEEHDAAAEAVADWNERMGDTAEEKLFQLIRQGEIKAIIYYLSTKHKHRGYGLKFDVGLQSGQPADSAVVSSREVLAAIEGMSSAMAEERAKIIDITPHMKPNGHAGNGHT